MKNNPEEHNTHAIINILDDSPVFEPNLPPGVSQVSTQKNQNLDLTCSVHETTVETPERFCPNSMQTWTLYCPKCDKFYILPVGCHQRTCSFCSNQRKNQLIWKYQDSCRDMKNPKLLTLTSPYFKNPRQGCLEMRAAFRRLRQRMPFKLFFKKGIYGFHFIPKPGGMWYVHIHALVDTKYIPQAILKRAWSKCLPGAKVVDIRKAWSPKGGLKYILGYITASKNLEGHEDYFNAEMKGARIVSTLGDMRAIPLPQGQFICPHCGSASYGYAHRTKYFVKWHNYNRKKTKQEVIIPYEEW